MFTRNRNGLLPANRSCLLPMLLAALCVLLPLNPSLSGMDVASATKPAVEKPAQTVEIPEVAPPSRKGEELPVTEIFADLTPAQELLRKDVDAKIRAQAALLVDVTSGKILYAKNIHDQHEPASTTKLLTALLAVELRDMNGSLLITEEDTRVVPSHVPLIPGEVVEADKLLASTLIGSGNDSAIALGRYAAGDSKTFMALMNEYAQRLGCRNSVFENPNGLPAQNQFTTAADLMIIFEHVLERPDLVRILSTPQFTLETRARTQVVRNHNKLLGKYDGMGPAKTGWTRASMHTYAAQATRGDRTLRLTLLKSPNKWNDARELFDLGFAIHPPSPPDVFVAAGEIEQRLLSSGHTPPTSSELLERLTELRESLADPLNPDAIEVAELVLKGPASKQSLRSPLAQQYFEAATAQPSSTDSIQVRAGDTLAKIASRHNTSVEEIIKLNEISDPNRIFPGDVLLVPQN